MVAVPAVTLETELVLVTRRSTLESTTPASVAVLLLTFGSSDVGTEATVATCETVPEALGETAAVIV